MLRKRFLEELDRIGGVADPKALIRDPQLNECVSLPIAHRSAFIDGLSFEEHSKHPLLGPQLRGYVFQAGQPDEVRKSYEEAMGIYAFKEIS